MPKIVEREIFVKYNHHEHGLVRTIDKMYEHPVTREDDTWFKIEVVGSNPTLYHYVRNNDLKYV